MKRRALGCDGVGARHDETETGRQSFADKKNYPKRLLYYPVFEINDAQAAKSQQANKREQTITPLHARDVAMLFPDCQSRSRKALVDLGNHRQSAPYARAGDAHYS